MQELTEKFKIGEETANNLKRTFKGVFALFDIGLQGVKALVGGFADLIGYVARPEMGFLVLQPALEISLLVLMKPLNLPMPLTKLSRESEISETNCRWSKTFVKTVADAFSEFANVDTSGLDNFADKVQTRFEPFVKLGELVRRR